MTDGTATTTITTSHTSPLQHACRICTHPDSAGMSVHAFHTMTGPLPRKVVPFHHTGESTPLAGPDHVDVCRLSKQLDGQLLTNLKIDILPIDPELADEPLWLAVGLLGGLHPRLSPSLGTLARQSGHMASLAPTRLAST